MLNERCSVCTVLRMLVGVNDSDGCDNAFSVLVAGAASSGVCMDGCDVLCTSGSVLVAGAASSGGGEVMDLGTDDCQV